MVIESKAPTRISLIGGGTDLPSYADTFGGLVLNIAINLRSKIKIYTEDDIFKIHENILPIKGKKEFMDAFIDDFKFWNDNNLRYQSYCEVPLESGMGSSAASGVAMVGALAKARKLNSTREEIAEKTWDIEINKLGLYGGKQDQYASSLGGVNFLEFTSLGVKSTPLSPGFIEKTLPSLVLMYTNKTRNNPTIQEGFKEMTIEQINTLHQMKQLAITAADIIGKGDIEKLGNLLNRAWYLKKRSNKGVSEPWLDKIYESAKKFGSLGGKVCGAGGGGFMVFVVKPNKKEQFIEKMEKEGLEWYDFNICWNGLEVKVLSKQL